MLRQIPWDVWVAAALAFVVGLLAIFDPAPSLVIAVYVALCIYVTVETFGGRH
jgi:uncharacterized membrane protein HdeD (DUF308 family)